MGEEKFLVIREEVLFGRETPPNGFLRKEETIIPSPDQLVIPGTFRFQTQDRITPESEYKQIILYGMLLNSDTSSVLTIRRRDENIGKTPSEFEELWTFGINGGVRLQDHYGQGGRQIFGEQLLRETLLGIISAEIKINGDVGEVEHIGYINEENPKDLGLEPQDYEPEMFGVVYVMRTNATKARLKRTRTYEGNTINLNAEMKNLSEVQKIYGYAIDERENPRGRRTYLDPWSELTHSAMLQALQTPRDLLERNR